ncbi:MAG: hypothetical protein GX640_23000 [Fibrobacter sp.]|nr:hypothetical protein [Fibrobacter sp.]
MVKLWSQNRSNVLVCLGVVVFFFTVIRSDASALGGYSGDYLRLGIGGTALGMGNANTASPEYLMAWWNAAALSFVKKSNLSAGLGIRSFGRSDAFLEFDFRVPPRVGVGLFLMYRGDPFLNDLYDAQENPLPGAAYTTITGKIALSYYLSRKWSVGAGVSVLYKQLPTSYFDGLYHFSKATSIGSVDLAVLYKPNENWIISAVIKSLGANLDWIVNVGEYGPLVNEKILPTFILGSWHQGKLLEKPFIWTLDLKGYLVDGSFKRLEHPEGVINTGFEWRYWEMFYLRAGISEFLLNGELLRDRESYFSNFPFKVTAGFSFKMLKNRKGLSFNYGISTDKIGAGLDQQLDMRLGF